MPKKSDIEEMFNLHLKAHGINAVREHKFHPTRKWRFDFAIPERMIAIECEGGIWVGGRHSTGAGMIKDMEKYNHAAWLGWCVFRFDGGAVERGEAIQFLNAVLNEEKL